MCVFLSLENTRGVSFVDVERNGQNVISICWGQSGRILFLSIAGIFQSQQLQKCLVVIYRLHVYQLLPYRINAIKIFLCFAGNTMPINDSGKDQENF